MSDTAPQAGEDRDGTEGWEDAKKLPDDRAYEDRHETEDWEQAYEDRVETEDWERTSAEPGESDDSADDS